MGHAAAAAPSPVRPHRDRAPLPDNLPIPGPTPRPPRVLLIADEVVTGSVAPAAGLAATATPLNGSLIRERCPHLGSGRQAALWPAMRRPTVLPSDRRRG
jgi:hypothetical protein